ncbi:MAG: 2-dehydro-3-deoxygalactonokinase [Burkholderiales bacterium]|nr:2-dehydro-3-deoxygalactonokinase [Burkholderiales bacterium]
MSISLIALDWGTTSLRAYLIGDDGVIAARREGGPGIMRIEGGAFEAALRGFCGDWLDAHPQAVLMACGMIGSKQGLIEAPYCLCPAGAAQLAAHVVRVTLSDGRQLAIVPGVSTVDASTGVPDVMRGEETQIVGAVPPIGNHVVVLPGTHSKWAWVEDGAIKGFASFMTGEVYAALMGHTILGRLMASDAAHDAASFSRGVAYGLEAPQQFLHRIFSARTLGLFGTLESAALPSYLSGLLIGAEIGGAHSLHPVTGRIILLGSANLTARYAEGMKAANLATVAGAPEAAACGLTRLAKA